MNLKSYIMLHLKVHLSFQFREHHKNLNNKTCWTLEIMVHLTVEMRGYLRVHLKV